MTPTDSRLFREPPPYGAMPRRKCITENCSHDAYGQWPYCEDCDSEMKHTFPDIWLERTRVYREENGT